MITFVVDRIENNRPYPALQHYPRVDATKPWAETYPYTQPPDLINYCEEFGVEYRISTIDTYDRTNPDNYYIIHIGFFDHCIDYIELLPNTVKDAVRSGSLRILFYYHEGDNPERIKSRLDALCELHAITVNSYIFITGNTSVEKLSNFIHFTDHELLFYLRNKNDKKILKNGGSLMRRFTSLVRTHQWWRATALADLYRRGLLDNSYWSYNPYITVGNTIEDCPIEIDTLEIRDYLKEFMQGGPYRADDLDSSDHNNHQLTVVEHYENSACNIVFETFFDADGSGGAFLSEKTFKPIKHGQPFVIVGTPGSLQLLRSMGYRVFDSVIDNSYDRIQDNTQRWLAVRRTIELIANSNLQEFQAACRQDVEHNQRLFLQSKQDRLNMLFQQLQKQ